MKKHIITIDLTGFPNYRKKEIKTQLNECGFLQRDITEYKEV